MSKSNEILAQEIADKAFELGWDDVGITTPKIPEVDIQAYFRWIQQKSHGDMAYMEKEIRCYPEKLLPGAKSAIIFVTYYKQQLESFYPDRGVIASYARGRDYHKVHHKRLRKFITWLEERAGQTEIARGFSDSSPILEKALAVQAGLGWFGKNTLLIHRRFGTFTLLSGLLTTLEIAGTIQKTQLPKCGSCTRCLDACPTQALTSPYHLDATRCLSYHLIESKDPLPNEIRNRNPGYVFGCDICQDVCPHNTRKPLSLIPEFSPSQGMGSTLTLEQLNKIEEHPEILYGTPLQRRGVSGLKHTMKD